MYVHKYIFNYSFTVNMHIMLNNVMLEFDLSYPNLNYVGSFERAIYYDTRNVTTFQKNLRLPLLLCFGNL